MDLQGKITLLERAVLAEHTKIRLGCWIAVGGFIAGVIGVCLVQFFAPAAMGKAKLALSVCTLFGSLLPALPLKEIPSKRLKIDKLCYMKSEYQYFRENPSTRNEQRFAKIEDRFWPFFDKL